MMTAAVRFRVSQSGSTNYEVKIDEPLSGPPRAESEDETRKGRGRRTDGGGKMGES